MLFQSLEHLAKAALVLSQSEKIFVLGSSSILASFPELGEAGLLDNTFDAGFLDTDGVAQQLAQRIQEPLPRVRAMVVDIAHALTPIAASVALLQHLHQWRRAQATSVLNLFYLSNMPEPYADHLVASHGFFSCFDVVFSRAG